MNFLSIWGVLASLIVLLPYTGKIYQTLPALVLSYLLFIPFFIVTTQKILKEQWYPSGRNLFLLLGILLFILLILMSAQVPQYVYLTELERWKNYSACYFDSKLAVIVIGNLPSLWCIFVLLCLKNSASIHYFMKGIRSGILLCAVLILIKLDIYLPNFLSSAYQGVVNFYLGVTSQNICMTGSSPILSSAVILSFLLLRHMSLRQKRHDKKSLLSLFAFLSVSCVFVFHLFWTRQRLDCLLCHTLLFSFSLFSSLKNKRWTDINLYLLFLGCSTLILWISFPSSYWEYWENLIQRPALASQHRTQLISLYVENMTSFSSVSSSHPLSFGKGLGSFSLIDPYRKYPHNILLESFYEIGIGAFLLLSLYTGWALFRSFRILFLGKDFLLLCNAFICLIFLGHAFKSGDLSYLGVYFFMSCLMLLPSSKPENIE